MLETKQATYITTAKGSKELRDGLQTGDIKAISRHFGRTYTTTYNIITGKHAGDKDIVQCAERIVAYYRKTKLKENVNQIIKSYEPINQNRK